MTFAISQQNISMIDSLVNVGNHLYSSKIANAKQTKIDDFQCMYWCTYYELFHFSNYDYLRTCNSTHKIILFNKQAHNNKLYKISF